MITETLIHIDESLNRQQRDELLQSLGNHSGGMEAHHHSEKSHLLFVAYDDEECCPHDVVEMVKEQGLHAQLIDL